MLSASTIFKLLIEDDPPASVPDDPNQLALDFNPPEDMLDFKSELMRYADEFRIPGAHPNETYRYFAGLFGPRVRRDQEGHRRKKLERNTYLIDYDNRIAVRFYLTDVVTAYTDNRVVVETGGWHPGGGRYMGQDWGYKPASGVTTLCRIAHMQGTAGGWRIFRKQYLWYWYNPENGRGSSNDDRLYPFTSGDTIYPDGSLKIQAEPIEVRHRKRS